MELMLAWALAVDDGTLPAPRASTWRASRSLPESGTVPVNDFVSLECVHGAVVQMVVN